MLQINPALCKVWITPNTVQYGYPRGIRLEGLSVPQERMLHFMEQGYLPEQLQILARIAGCSEAELSALQGVVTPLIGDWTVGLNRFEASYLQTMQPEIHRLMMLRKPPAQTLWARSAATVFISDLGKFGSLLLDSLVGLGFRRFVTSDSSLRNPASQLGNTGLSRLQLLKQSLPKHCELQLHSLLHESTVQRVRLAVLVEFEVCNPVEIQFWQSFDVPVLRVRFTESGAAVQQLLPGEATLESELSSKEVAVAEAQLAKSPRRLETTPAVLLAAEQTMQSILILEEQTQWRLESSEILLPSG